MLRSVVVPAADAERRRQEPFLDVVPDRAPRDAAEVRQVTNCVAGFLGHVPSYTTVTVALSTVVLSPANNSRSAKRGPRRSQSGSDPGLTPSRY